MLLRVALLAILVSPAFAQSNTFDIQSGNRSIGKDTYTLVRTKQGYKLNSHPTTHFGGTDSSLNNEFTYDENYAFVVGSSSNMVNQMHTSYTPNKTRTSLVIGMVQSGVQDSHFLDIKPDFTVMPAYDAGAAQAMLLLATTHPTAANLYNIVVPGIARSGLGPPSGAERDTPTAAPCPGNFAYDALWISGPAASGILDGKPVQLHTYILTAGNSTWTFFADPSNTLMQLDVSVLKTSYIRANFKLDTPK